MIPLSKVAQEIDRLERQGLPRAAAERKFWDTYRAAERMVSSDSHPSFGALLESVLHSKTRDGIIGKKFYMQR